MVWPGSTGAGRALAPVAKGGSRVGTAGLDAVPGRVGSSVVTGRTGRWTPGAGAKDGVARAASLSFEGSFSGFGRSTTAGGRGRGFSTVAVVSLLDFDSFVSLAVSDGLEVAAPEACLAGGGSATMGAGGGGAGSGSGSALGTAVAVAAGLGPAAVALAAGAGVGSLGVGASVGVGAGAVAEGGGVAGAGGSCAVNSV